MVAQRPRVEKSQSKAEPSATGAQRARAQKPQKRAPSSVALGAYNPTKRLLALKKQHERLLQQLLEQKAAVTAASAEARVSSEAVFLRLEPFVSKRNKLAGEIKALFGELLVEGRLSRSASKKVSRVLRSLEETGGLDEIGSGDRNAKKRRAAGTADPFADESFSDEADAARRAQRFGPDAASATAAGHEPGHESLRELFRRLARNLHPDHARDDPERERRTEVMKEITQAFREGDLARLLEIERAWHAGVATELSADEGARAEQSLERLNRELKAQLALLTRELGALQGATPDGTFVEAMVAEAKEELEALEEMREHVRAFLNRKISLAQFLAGPAPSLPEVDEIDNLEELLFEFLGGDVDEEIVVKRPRRGNKKKKGK